ncbi:MAG: fluoride efflux transporter FluC [Amnibacterium sp.]
MPHVHPHRSPVLAAAVFAGGAVGTALRAGIGALVPPVDSVPLATIGINVLGAFALGLLLAVLGRRGPDLGGRRALRLTVGTGVLGGFTTFSALAVDTAGLLQRGQVLEGLLYVAGTVLPGLPAPAARTRLGGLR